MINFASLFNQFRGSSNNPLNELLQQEDLTLTQLLDEDAFINEFKSGNTKLFDFLKYDQMKQLVELITVVGPPEDKKRSYKFPLTATEALGCQLNAVSDFFFPEGKLYVEKITFENQVVETEIEGEQLEQKESTQSEEKAESEKQKTIIKDSLETTDQQPGPRPKSPQNTPVLQNQAKELPQAIKEQTEQKVSQRPKIKVQKIQQVQKIQKIEVEPLIHHLFNYFDQEVNYILTGYVCKVLTSLFNKKGNQMMDFLFKQNRVSKMVNHIESRSVGEFLLKVLTFQSAKYSKERAEFFNTLLLKISQSNSIHVLSNFSSFISETIEKAAANTKSSSAVPEFTNIFFTSEIVTIVIKNIMSEEQNVSIYNAPILLTYLTNVPFTLPQDENIINQFKVLLEMFIDKSLQKLNVTSRDRTKLGVGRVKIIEILNYILKENLLGSRDIFASKQRAFEILFTLCKNYELNNVLHNQVVKMISLAFSDPNLSKSVKFKFIQLARNDVLLNFIHSEAEEDLKIRNKTGSQKFRKGFIGHVVQISRLVQEYASKDNEVAIQILERDEFDKTLTILVEKQVSEGNKSLGGYTFKRQLKTEDIITHFIDFLTHSPKPVFEKEPEPINIEHPDFLQEMQRQIEENLSIEQNSKSEVKQEGKEKGTEGAQTILGTQAPTQINFFKNHLDYNVDDLMNDL